MTFADYFFVWQEPLIGQSEQPQPQDETPFLRFLTIPAITAATIAISAAQIRIVAMFEAIHSSICFTSLAYYDLTLYGFFALAKSI